MVEIRPVKNLDELSKFFSVSQQRHENETGLIRATRMLEEGKTKFENYICVFDSDRLIGALTITNSIAPLIPRISLEASRRTVEKFESYLHNVSAQESRSVLIRSNLCSPCFIDSDKWRIIDHQLFYQTDLSKISDQNISENILIYSSGTKLDPDIRQFMLGMLDEDNDISDFIDGSGVVENIEILIIFDDAEPCGCAAVFLDRPDFASIRIVGVSPKKRGLGFGKQLHHAALVQAARYHSIHKGTTHINNLPMIKIFQANTSIVKSEDIYIRAIG